MHIAIALIRALAVAAFTIVVVGAPAAAPAQNVPSYSHQPSQATETIRGRIEAVRSAFRISVRDERGFVDEVQLHHGTIITPRGLTLTVGMEVTIVGTNGGSVLDAVEVDTPYGYDGGAPAAVAYGPGWWYPGYDYGYGPAFALGLAYGAFAPGFAYGGYVPGVAYVIVQRPFRGRPWFDGDDKPPPGHAWRHVETAHAPAANAAPAYRAPAYQAPAYQAPPPQNAPVRAAQPHARSADNPIRH